MLELVQHILLLLLTRTDRHLCLGWRWHAYPTFERKPAAMAAYAVQPQGLEVAGKASWPVWQGFVFKADTSIAWLVSGLVQLPFCLSALSWKASGHLHRQHRLLPEDARMKQSPLAQPCLQANHCRFVTTVGSVDVRSKSTVCRVTAQHSLRAHESSGLQLSYFWRVDQFPAKSC